MITRLRSFVLAPLAALLVIGASHATPPLIVPAPIGDFTDATCGFPLHVHFTTNAETAKIFSDGMIIVSGPLVATYSANGKSLSLNIAGPTMISPAGTVIGHGVGAGPILLPNGDLTFGYGTGEFDVDFTIGAAVLVHGHLLLDICAALAP